MEYFVQPIIWSERTLHLIYYSNDQDGVVMQTDKSILACATQAEAEQQAKKRKHKLQESLPLLDLDAIQSWSSSRSARLLDANLLYRAWNFLGDVATSMDNGDSYLGYDEDYASIHEELFWGCNLPGFSQSQERYEIDLSQGEIRQLRSILKSGLEIFQQGLH